jgi:energy-coupling factor transporter ATP-binding protein EcfA2
MSDKLPPGNQFVEPPPEYTGNLKTMNWGGFYVKVGLGYSPFFFNELERIRRNIEACIIAVTGKGGSGKTYFALRMAQIMDPKFNPEVQVPFGSEELMALIGDNSPLKMGQVIIIDESQFGMSSRDWFNDMQKDIMKQIEAIRSRGFIIFIVALNTKTLDVIARNYVMTHLIHMLHRGEGTVYKFYMPAFAQEPYKTKLGKVRLNIPGYEECKHPTCLRCPSSGLKPAKWKNKKRWIESEEPICFNLRAIYERKKKSYLESEAQKVDQKREAKKEKTQGVNYEELAALISFEEYNNLPSTLKNTRKDPEAVASLLSKKRGKLVSTYTANKVRSIKERASYRVP